MAGSLTVGPRGVIDGERSRKRDERRTEGPRKGRGSILPDATGMKGDGSSAFAILLHSARQRAGLTQRELAERSGLGLRTLRDLEGGRTCRPHQATVRLLAAALGIDGPDRETFERLAAGRSEGVLVDPLALPHQLPRDLPDFTGRTEEAACLRELAMGDSTLVVVSGPPGIGKTALTVHVAQQLQSSFRQGQLFVDLRGTCRPPVSAHDALDGFLRACGAQRAAIPEDTAGRAALYRTRLAGGGFLVVLDDAADEAHVRPLLPAAQGCATVITARSPLAGLEGARSLTLGAPPASDAIRLLAAVTGARRVGGEPDAAAAIVACCACLPLAVRVAGARAAARPHQSLRRLAERLSDEERRLDELEIGDLSVRACLQPSYLGVSEPAQGAFRALAPHAPVGLTAAVAAHLLGVGQTDAEDLLEELVDRRLLEVAGRDAGGALCYRYHELLRLYALELSGTACGPPRSR